MAINYASLGNALGTGLGAGLEQLAQNKMNKMHRQEFAQNLHKIGYTPEQADTLAYLQQAHPSAFHHIIGPARAPSGNVQPGQEGQQAQPLFGGQKKENAVESKELLQAKNDLKYLDELEFTLDELDSLANDKNEPVEFGVKSGILSSLPAGIGNQWLEGNTGAYGSLADKFHTDAIQNTKGVRSVAHIKILGGSKPGLNKTAEQNEKLRKYWKKNIEKKRLAVLKEHPELLNKTEAIDQQQMQQAKQSVQQPTQQESQPRFRKNVQGKVQQWDPVSQSYRDL